MVVVVVCGRLTVPSFSWALTSLPGAEFSCSRARVQRRRLCVVCFVRCVWWPRVREVAPLDDSTAPRPCLVEGRQTTLCVCVRLRYSSIDPIRLFTLVIWTGSGPLDLAMSLVAAVVGAGSDSLCLAVGVLLWRGGLSAGRLTQTIAATWVRIPATAPATFGVRSPCVDCELIVLHYSCLEFLSGCP